MNFSSNNVAIYPVVLAGGTGSRLWPLSRAAYPKQLLQLEGERTMLQSTLERAGRLAGAQEPFLVCNTEHRFLIRDQCLRMGCEPAAICLEPVGRNTAPAIALAALHLMATSPDAIMLVMPADHVIRDSAGFAATVASAQAAAQAGHLVTFGIPPTSAETGYGYIKVGRPLADGGAAMAVDAFVEKPDEARAREYLASGGYLWNSGMFMFSARRYLEELQAHRPDILTAAQRAWDARQDDLGFVRPGAAEFAACPAESIDYAVMQPTRQAAVVPARFDWSDVGSWDSLWQIADKDVNGNATQGDTCLLNTRNSYVNAQSKLVAVIGLDDIVVVETPDAVLVMRRDKAQKIKELVAGFETSGRMIHVDQRRTFRPWGWYESVDEGPRFKVKRILVRPGQKLSLQVHRFRAEHWIVASGTAQVTNGSQQFKLRADESTYIPRGIQHRLENAGEEDLVMIEVQSGDVLEENDITRLEDDYGRTEQP